MKDKNIPNNYNSLSIEELTNSINEIIEDLENQRDLDSSIEKYQKLLRLKNIIEKKFKKGVRSINEKTRESLMRIKLKKNAKKIK